MREHQTKVCGRCKQELPPSAFSPDKGKAAGLAWSCRKCRAKYLRGYYLVNRGRDASPEARARSAARAHKYYASPKGQVTRRAYEARPEVKARRAAAVAKRRASPEGHARREAQVALAHAIASQKVVRASACANCGAGAHLRGHHHLGYAQEHRLDVEWLCPRCHAIAHAAG